MRESNKANVRRFPRVARDAAACAAAVGVLLDSADSGPDITLDAVWEAIDAVVPRSDLRAAVENLTATLPPPDADPAGERRAELIERYAVVRFFVPQLCRTIEFGATAEAAGVLDALRQLPELLDARATKRAPTGWLDAAPHRRRRRAGGMVATARLSSGPAHRDRPSRRLRVLAHHGGHVVAGGRQRRLGADIDVLVELGPHRSRSRTSSSRARAAP